ncbi:aromatic prenyltransferase [Colletotrichum orchidophilum]|uniref:Aromatic prenyltransferase n=1 Tax=Colletotrichum orchidophilum TaxID=1209926 RepID=A0A1G4APK1_9PEZI|nr:aromatic prenyltransferase [Colletotrichum orchidophilum]OHE91118.1 aromatic prenyltransferase [Colletotrichum orchidophilum]
MTETYRSTIVLDDDSAVKNIHNLNSRVDHSFAIKEHSQGNPLVSSWLPTVQDTLSSLLCWTGSYSSELREHYLNFAREIVVPCLNPPRAADWPRYIGSHNHGPYELSIAFAPQKKAKVRFSIQPLADGNSVDDPLGQKDLRKKIEDMASACDADRKRLNTFFDSVFLTDEELANLLEKHASQNNTADVLPQQNCMVAFDLEPGSPAIHMKLYLFPQLKALATGRDLMDATESILMRLADGDEALLASWKTLRTFLTSDGKDNLIHFLAIDCVGPHMEPRFKVYAHTHVNSLASARRVITLGGRIPSPKFLDTLWPLLMDMEDVPLAERDGLQKPLREPDSKYCGLNPTFEQMPGNATPIVKMYVPIWQYARDEPGILQRYQRLLQTQGLGHYDIEAAAQCVFGDERDRGLHNMASIVSTGGGEGAAFTAYLGPILWE